ncbi:MAG: hypothetical protein HYZ53_27990 [Planctomycetes bacterium]|nr:hypothetical protein [Planctomycetota bacterium]
MIPLVLVLALALVAGLAWYFHRRRTGPWRDLATRYGMAYHPNGGELLRRFGAFKTFSLGHSGRARNLLHETDKTQETFVADFCYATGQGKDRRTHEVTVCILVRPGLQLAPCFLRREAPLDVLGKIFGGQDINFAQDGDFSQAYLLQGEKEDDVRLLFNPRVRRFFSGRKEENLHFEARGDTVLVHTGRLVGPERARDLVAQAREVLALWA